MQTRKTLLAGVCTFLISLSAISQNTPWRSELYPFNWKRGYARDGKFLHDFSFAGYHYGEIDIPNHSENILDVTLPPFNADKSGATDATRAIQAAIDSVAKLGKGVVFLPEGKYLVHATGTNALTIAHDNTVLRGAGPDKTFILNTQTNMRSKNIVQFSPGSASWYAPDGSQIMMTKDAMEQDSIIHLENAGYFTPGDRIILTTDFTNEFIAEHFMTGKWNTSIEGVAFARTVKAVNASENTILIDIPIRYYMKLRDKARAYKMKPHLRECGIENLSIGNLQNPKTGLGDGDYSSAGTAAYEVHASHAIRFNYSENCWMKNVHTFKPEANTSDIHLLSNGLIMFQSRLITVESCVFQKPQYEGEGGNGYLFILQGNDCLIKNSQAIHSRHNYDFKKPYSNGNVVYKSLSKDSRLASDFHMHLSMTNLFDNHTVDNDFLEAVYRPYGTVEHGHSTTQSVFWNTTGIKYHGNSSRIIASGQFGHGYVIGTQGVAYKVSLPIDNNTAPKDHLEGEGLGGSLYPASLYEDQFRRRIQGLSKVDSTNWDSPIIQLTSPDQDSRIYGNSVRFDLSVEGDDSAISSVKFYEGENLLGESSTAPFTFLWENVEDGCYQVSAQAFAKSGTPSSRESAEVIVGKGCETSYYSFAFDLPGKVEAEYYNKGKNGLSYFDTDEANQGGAYRPNEPVDVEKCTDGGAGFNVGWIADGEYLRYIVSIGEAGLYDLSFRVASQNSGTINFTFTGQAVSGLVTAPTTGGWQTWQTVTAESVELTAGIDTVQLTFTGSFNLNYFEAMLVPVVLTSDMSQDILQLYPNPTSDHVVLRSHEPIREVTLLDLSGRKIATCFDPETGLVSWEELTSGLYLLQVRTESGLLVKKIMIEN